MDFFPYLFHEISPALEWFSKSISVKTEYTEQIYPPLSQNSGFFKPLFAREGLDETLKLSAASPSILVYDLGCNPVVALIAFHGFKQGPDA